jgi:hypothetical protein
MIIYLHTLYSLVAILQTTTKRKRRIGMMSNKKKKWEKWTECMRRGVKVLMINILDSFTCNVVHHIVELGGED